MDLPNSGYLQLVLGIVSAVILFLFAIENLGREFQRLAVEEFRKKISKLLKNRFLGALVGAISTALVQSSTAITSVAIILVNTGIISFRNSLGIIFGSSIGTTVTAQLALLSNTPIAPILIILGFLMKFGGKKLKMASNPTFFLGFILFALGLLSSTIQPLKSNPEFIHLFSYLSHPLIAYVVASLLTVLIHSSSITSGIIVVLVSSGVLGINMGIPMILGANLGTAINTLLVSTNLNIFAKRASYANFFFKIIGTSVFMIFIYKFISLLQILTSNPGQQVAFGHLIFNFINTFFFLLILTPFEKFIIKIIPGNEEEVLFETKFINENISKKLSENVMDIKKEIVYSIENTEKIYKKALSIYYNPESKTVMEIDKLETLNDFLDDEITKALLSLSKYKLTRDIAKESVVLVKISNTIEQLGDLGIDFANIFKKMHSLDIPEQEVHIERLTNIFNKLMNLFEDIKVSIIESNEKKLIKIKEKEEEIYSIVNEEFNEHVRKLQESESYHGNMFVDAVSIVELSVSKLRDIRKLLLRHERSLKK